MTFILNTLIYYHDIINPPKHDRGSDIELVLANSNLISLRDVRADSSRRFVTPYRMEIRDPVSVGFSSEDESMVKKEFENLLTAFNLLLHRVCVLGSDTSFSVFDIVPNIPESQSYVEKKDDRYDVKLIDSVIITDSTFVKVGTKGIVDEIQLVDLFERLQRSGNLGIHQSSGIQETNFSRSLSEYKEAMASFETLYKFKHLFNSLEYSINIDGQDRRGVKFDKLFNSLVTASNTKIDIWRRLYNRTKHTEGNMSEVIELLDGIQKLGEYVLALRKSCSELLLQRLS